MAWGLAVNLSIPDNRHVLRCLSVSSCLWDAWVQEKAAAVQERQRRKAEAKLKAKGDRAPTQTKVRHPDHRLLVE